MATIFQPRIKTVNTNILLEVADLRTTLLDPRTNSQLPVVNGVSFRVRRGETFALLGESGCGKSLTALSLMRLLPENGAITAGSVRLNGVELRTLAELLMRRIRGRRMAMVFQEPQTALNPVMTIGTQVANPLRYHLGLRGRELTAQVVTLLNRVGIAEPERRMGNYPHQFSGGMKQRVGLAVALAGNPELLIADEPTTALDVTLQSQIMDLLREQTATAAMALLLITHDLGVVYEMADRVAVMYAGQIVEEAPRAQFFADPLHPYTRKLFTALPNRNPRNRPLAVIDGALPALQQELSGCRFAPRCEAALTLCYLEAPRWVVLPSGSAVRCHRHDPTLELAAPPGYSAPGSPWNSVWNAPSAPPLLEVRNLVVRFPLHDGLLRAPAVIQAVDGVSFDIGVGQTLALVGESGCGKTSIGRAILQLPAPSAGQVILNGTNLTWLSGDALRRQRREIQMVFQDPYASMNPRLRVGAIISEGMEALGMERSARLRRERSAQLLAQVGLSAEMLDRYPHEFSGGQRQRIALARALAVEPKLIICDEITSALDVSVQAQIINLLKELQNRLGIAYLFITHNLGVVEYLATRVAVMYRGRIVEQGGSFEVLKTPRHPYTRALLAAAPVVEPKTRRTIMRLSGEPPSAITHPGGCYFYPRCPLAWSLCQQVYPDTAALSDTHLVHCHLYNLEPTAGVCSLSS